MISKNAKVNIKMLVKNVEIQKPMVDKHKPSCYCYLVGFDMAFKVWWLHKHFLNDISICFSSQRQWHDYFFFLFNNYFFGFILYSIGLKYMI